MINIHMSFASVTEMQAAFAALSSPAPVAPETIQVQAAAAIEKAAKVEAPKPEKVAKSAKPVATQPAAQAPTEPSSPSAEPVPVLESPSKGPTLEEVRAKLTSLSQTGKSTEVKAIIAECGVAKLTEIPAELYASVLEKAAAL